MVSRDRGERVIADEVALRGGDPASVTLTLNVYWPAFVGVPLIAPVAAFRVSPGGRLPLATTKVYGEVPPVAAHES
jgi:hypothetical protein